MLLSLNSIPETVIPGFKGGTGRTCARIYADESNKIMHGLLPPGASIGALHTHETNCEVIYILSGTGKALCDDTEELLGPGSCHYCPMGHRHSLINCGSEDLVFFAVVPEHRL